jgi:hypothetical protein
MKYIIKMQGSFGEVVIGEGRSPVKAWEDAFGGPWTAWATSTKLSAKKAWCEKIEDDEEVSYSGY